ncbi:MAG: MBL fold metallo-hydrolase, partial [Chloroflexi bacterium]
MKIHFLGAAQTVTGSQHLLEVNGRRLLLDCGLYQGKRAESFEVNRNFAFNPADLDAVIISHAHIDHSGNLPNLVKKGYAGKIYTTDVSSHLMDIMLLDSAHIHESDAEYLNRKRKGSEPEIVPLYTIADAAAACELFQGIPYNQPFEPIPGVTATLVEAGHILGSASVVLDIQENGSTIRLWYSGDIGRMRLPLVRDPVLPREADYLIMECTYGDKSHEDPEEAYDQLR